MMGGGAGSMSGLFAVQGGSPDQPLRLGRQHRSPPNKFTPNSDVDGVGQDYIEERGFSNSKSKNPYPKKIKRVYPRSK